METNIPDNYGKGKPFLKVLFWPALLILLAFGAFGIGKLHTLEQLRQPAWIEYPTTAATTTPAAAATPPFQGGEVKGASTSTPAASSTGLGRATTGKYVAARGGTSYYLPSCSGAKRISDKNKIWFDTKAEAEKLGYKPATTCKGL